MSTYACIIKHITCKIYNCRNNVIVNSSRKKKSTVIYENVMYAVNQAKWAAAKKYAKKKNMEFIILTENEVNLR